MRRRSIVAIGFLLGGALGLALACGEAELSSEPGGGPPTLRSGGGAGSQADSEAVSGGSDARALWPDAALPLPFASLEWTEIGNGVGFKDSGDAAAEGVFIGYAGYQVTDDETRGWVNALYDAVLADYGVRYVYAVRGPQEVQYDSRELSNSLLIRAALPQLAESDAPLIVVAHSSGAFVACELFEQLFEGGFDPSDEAQGRVVYHDLDGAYGCLTEVALGAMRGAFFVRAQSGGGDSLNAAGMVTAAARFPEFTRLLTYDATHSGCQPDARMCLHMTLINTLPHDPTTAMRTADYSDFDGRPVNRWYLDVSGDLLAH